MDCSPPGSSIHGIFHPWDSPGKNTGVGCHFLLQGISSTQGSNPGLPHSRGTLYHLSHLGSPALKAENDIIFVLPPACRRLGHCGIRPQNSRKTCFDICEFRRPQSPNHNFCLCLTCPPPYWKASQVVLVIKNPPANGENVRNTGLIPGLGRSLEEGMATHSSILAWRVPWMEEPWQAAVHRVAQSWT